MAIYGLYIIYAARSDSAGSDINLRKKLDKTLFQDNSEEKENLPLLKAEPETYFKSKLPKVEGLREWIQHSGLEINPSILIAIGFLIGISMGGFFVILHANILVSILLGIIGGFVIPWSFIAFLTSRRKKQFLEEFPIALDIVRRALRAGHSVDRAITMVVEQMTGPVGLAFKQIVDKLRIGSSFENVLAEMSNRIGIDDFRMLAIVIVLQRETGGSLAEAIDNFSKIIRARQQLRKKVKSLTAEVRATAMILTAIPFVIFATVYLTTPKYFNPLFYTENGQILLITGISMLVLGIAVIMRMTYRETY